MKETVDTLGNQKKMNYALNQPNKEAFIKAVTDGLLPPPAYFPMNVAMNKKGYQSFEEVKSQALNPVKPADLALVVEATNALMLDVRSASDFGKGFIPRSVNIGLDGQFAPWVGALIKDVNQPLLLITYPGKEEEAVTRLSRVGFDHVIGYLEGGYDAWEAAGMETDKVNRITAQQFKSEFTEGESFVIDVRKESEYLAEHVSDAYNKPLDFINEWTGALNPDEPFYLHCAGGYRSMMAASILKARGIHNFKEIEGGFKAIAEAGVPKTDFVCQSKMLS